MSYPGIPPQGCFFYVGSWNEPTVNSFINFLVEEKAIGCWDVGGDNEPSLLSAFEFMTNTMEYDLSWTDIVEQYHMLKKRYLTFKAMLEVEGVDWDRNYNHVYALAEKWIGMVKANDFVKAFYHKGDLMYDTLESLFGYEHDLSNAIIQLSSDDKDHPNKNSAKNPISVDDPDEEQEVESPNVGSSKIPRKRLFHDELIGKQSRLLSAESRTAKKNESSSKVVRMKALFTDKSALPPKPKTKDVVLLVPKKETSSSASCSPFKVPKNMRGDA